MLTGLAMTKFMHTSQDAHSRAAKMFRQRKRSQDIQRSYERQCKFRMESELAPTFDEDTGECSKCESMPPISLAVKVSFQSSL